MQYTPSQQEAIDTIDQNLQIIACAGSGKTQVISARIVEILSQGAAPAEIVAFTFTEKAAAELKDRIDRLCRERLGTNRGLGDMFVGTIHGYCLNLLQSPPLYRYLKYGVLNDVQQRLLIDRNSKQSGLTQTPLLSGKGTLSRWKDSRLYQSILSVYYEGAITAAEVPDEVHAALAAYRDLLHDKRQLDFTMIVAEAVEALETHPAMRQQIADQVHYLVVDEYQDVNPLQERLIRQLHDLGANLCVVGDDDQTIYQWRGSDVNNILTFARRYPNVKQVRLNENFRSSVGVVESAREVIEVNDPDRLPKRMESTDAQPFEYGHVLAMTFDDPESEADWIVARIEALYGTAYEDRADRDPRGLAYSDFAVLLRSVKNDAGPIVEALDEAGIPYVTGGVNRLFDTPEARAMQTMFAFMGEFAPRNRTAPTLDDVGRALREAGLGLSRAQIAQGLEFLTARKAMLDQNDRDALLYLQRLYLDFLEQLELREEAIPRQGARTGEIIFFNLGKFSQVITDFETINFHSDPQSLYNSFASFLHYQAADYYPEGWEEAGYAQLDAVQIVTVHQAKGMQWPVVFVPCLRHNRFPSKRHGGRQVWHIIPETAVPNVDRYKGTVEDERRLFYVATTRAERYLFCSFSPIMENRLYKKLSTFQKELTSSAYVLTSEPPVWNLPPVLTAQPRRTEVSMPLTFSELKYFFECAYAFKLRFLYGFDEPVSRALGYGKSLHDALAQIHAESLRGNIPTQVDVPDLVDEHLHLPFANRQVRENLEKAATKALSGYLKRNQAHLDKIEHVEKMVELKLNDGIVVNGRIDLIRRTDTNETIIVDFKSSDQAQAEMTTRQQLQIYAVGYEQLTGNRADLIEIHNLDSDTANIHRELIDQNLIQQTVTQIERAGRQLRVNNLPRLKNWCNTCSDCSLAGICRSQT